MKSIYYICVLIILLHITRAEIICKDSETNAEHILNLTNYETLLKNFISETNEKLKYITEHLNKQCNDVHSSKPENCFEALKNTHKTGIHEILVPSISSKPFEVFCDGDTHNGGWTVIARRMDNSTDFNRNWAEYKKGFGNLNGNFFIGLDTLHAMTTGDRKQELLIKLRDFYDYTKFAKYNEFEIGNEAESYVLKTLGSYTGDAGDSLSPHVGQKFSTKDVDNDDAMERSCAQSWNGPWWYHDCANSLLFAAHKRPEDLIYISGFGIHWQTFNPSKWVNLKFVEMLIRPVIE